MSSVERAHREGLAQSLAAQRYNFDLMSTPHLHNAVSRLLSSGRLNDLGVSAYENIIDLLVCKQAPQAVFARSLNEARGLIREQLRGSRLAYITGGLEASLYQVLSLESVPLDGVGAVAIGIEGEGYVRGKGREPIFTLREKVSLWMQLVPDHAQNTIFAIPPKPDELPSNWYYDWLAKYLGVFKNPQTTFLGLKDSTPEIVAALYRRAASPAHIDQRALGKPPVHTSDQLN